MAKMRKCRWQKDTGEDRAVWETACGSASEFIADGPKENDFRFCPYCGGLLCITAMGAAYDGLHGEEWEEDA